MSAIFYANEEQRRLAEASLEREAARRGKAVQTEITPLETFYRAEDYHQKYVLQGRRDVMAEFRAMYPEMRAFVDSTAATRTNGYLGGYGTPTQLGEEIDDLGLSPAAQQQLRKAAEQNAPAGCSGSECPTE